MWERSSIHELKTRAQHDHETSTHHADTHHSQHNKHPSKQALRGHATEFPHNQACNCPPVPLQTPPENLGIPTIRFRNLKHQEGNCIRHFWGSMHGTNPVCDSLAIGSAIASVTKQESIQRRPTFCVSEAVTFSLAETGTSEFWESVSEDS